jgi:hypothetical protein
LTNIPPVPSGTAPSYPGLYPGGVPSPAENSGGSVLRWYAAVLRRRWKWIALGVLAGLIGGLLSTLTQHQTINPTRYYKATNTLSVSTLATGQNAPNLQQAAFLLNASNLNSRIANAVGVDALVIQNQVAAVAKPEVSAVEVTAISTDPAQAVKMSDTAADQLATFWLESQNASWTQKHNDAQQAVNDDLARQQDLQKQIDAAGRNSPLLNQLQNDITAAGNQ